MDEVDRLVPIKTDAVAGAVRQTGKMVARAKTLFLIKSADGVINLAGGHAHTCGSEGDLLAFVQRFPDLADIRGHVAGHKGVRNVRLIVLYGAAAIHQHHFAFAHTLRLV